MTRQSTWTATRSLALAAALAGACGGLADAADWAQRAEVRRRVWAEAAEILEGRSETQGVGGLRVGQVLVVMRRRMAEYARPYHEEPQPFTGKVRILGFSADGSRTLLRAEMSGALVFLKTEDVPLPEPRERESLLLRPNATKAELERLFDRLGLKR